MLVYWRDYFCFFSTTSRAGGINAKAAAHTIRVVDEVKLLSRCVNGSPSDQNAMEVDQRRQRAITTATVADTYETDRNAE